jgi:uncharacterized protein
MTVAVLDRPTSQGVVAYVAPITVFMLFTTIESVMPTAWYPVAYAVKVLAVTATLAICRAAFLAVTPSAAVLLPASATGLLVFVVWIGIEKALPYPHIGERMAFDPYASIDGPFERAAFLAVRVYGLALMVPVMEELFWRAFVLRYLTARQFSALPVHAFSWSAFAVVAGTFALAHPEWLPAAITACTYGLLLRLTRSVFATIVAHGTTNALLAAYILATREWVFW